MKQLFSGPRVAGLGRRTFPQAAERPRPTTGKPARSCRARSRARERVGSGGAGGGGGGWGGPEAAAGGGAGAAAAAFALVRSRSSREEKFQKNCLSLSKISVKQEDLKYLP